MTLGILEALYETYTHTSFSPPPAMFILNLMSKKEHVAAVDY